jgi:hypothetical protein
MTDTVHQRLKRVEEITRQMHTLHEQFNHPDTPDHERRRLHRQMRALYIEAIAASEGVFLGILESMAPPPSNRLPGVLPLTWGRAINYPKLLVVMALFSLVASWPLLT